MPKAIIHYFSGTGNTYKAATVVERRLLGAGYMVQWQLIDRSTIPPVNKCDLHLFMFPVYACDMPDIMARYMWKLSPGNGVKAAVIATNGSLHATTRIPGAQGDPGWSFDHAYMILRLKGFNVVLADAAPYPAGITEIIPSPGDSQKAQILGLGNRRVDMLAQKLISGERSVRHNLLLSFLYAPFGLAYGLFGRHFLGKLYVADDKCNGCGRCAKSCPSGVIRLTWGRPAWDWRCQGCQRCINICPKHAINTSIIRLALILGIPFVSGDWLYAWITNLAIIPFTGAAGAIAGWSLTLALMIALMYIADKAAFLLERAPLVRRVMAINFNWWFRRYLVPEFRAKLTKSDETAATAKAKNKI